MKCLFCAIISGDVPAQIIHEDEKAIAFHDIKPQAPLHLLIIPKKHLTNLNMVNEHDQSLLGHLLLTVKNLAQKFAIAEKGYRTVINCNRDGGQEVDHLHIHLLAKRAMTWPPG